MLHWISQSVEHKQYLNTNQLNMLQKNNNLCLLDVNLLKEKVTPRNIFFLPMQIYNVHNVKPIAKVSASKVRVFLLKFVSR